VRQAMQRQRRPDRDISTAFAMPSSIIRPFLNGVLDGCLGMAQGRTMRKGEVQGIFKSRVDVEEPNQAVDRELANGGGPQVAELENTRLVHQAAVQMH
jgi:hypothetical protein